MYSRAAPPDTTSSSGGGCGAGGSGAGGASGASGAGGKDWKSEHLLQRAAAASEIRRAQEEAVAKAREDVQRSVSERKETNRARVEEGKERSRAAQQRKVQKVLEAAAAVRMPYRPMPDASMLAGVEPASPEETLELAEACARRLVAMGEEQARGKRQTASEVASRRPTWYALFQKIDADLNGTIDFEEYRALVRGELGLSLEAVSAEALKRAWKAIDTDGDNFITCGEVGAPLCKRPQARADPIPTRTPSAHLCLALSYFPPLFLALSLTHTHTLPHCVLIMGA